MSFFPISSHVGALPGITSALESAENVFWWGPPEQIRYLSAPIVGTSRDSGNTPTTVLRPGLLLGKIASSGKLTQWSPTATDGSQYIYGVLLYATPVQSAGTDLDRWTGWVMVGGCVRPSKLLIGGNSDVSIVGDNNEYLVRAQMAPFFQFDDSPLADRFGGWKDTRARTSDLTLTAADRDTVFTNLGATSTVIFTLPAPKEGLRYGFFVAADYTVTVASAAAGQLIVDNNAAASTYSISTSSEKIGRFVELVGLSTTKWAVIPHLYAPSGASTASALAGLITGTHLDALAAANVIGAVPVIHQVTVAAGANGDTDVTLTHKTRVLDAWMVLTGAGVASAVLTVKNGATAITNGMDASGSDKALVRAATIDDAQHEIAAAGTLRVTGSGGASQPAAIVYVLGIRVD